MKKATYLIPLALTLILASCQNPKEQSVEEEIKFNIEVKNIKMNGKDAKVFNLNNGNGMEVELTNYGATLSRIKVPDRDGDSGDIMLTYNKVEDFATDSYFFGATAGRYANRIAQGKFELDGQTFQLATNNGKNHLHGGKEGFNQKIWDAEVLELEDAMGVKMTYVSPDGEEGYPGTLTSTITFILGKENKLSIEIEAATDKATIVNLTQHGYFNLSDMKEDILGHEMTIFADHYTPVDAGLIPTGEIAPVAGTPFDFTTPHKIGERISETGSGYDHNFVVKKEHDGQLTKMTEAYHAGTGRVFTMYSNMPGVQFYTGNFLDGKQTTNGVTYVKNYGFCVEPQFFPDSPNQPSFPSARLNPGETYNHKIEYVFGVR
jgi:aldose 1-epimerase